MGQDAVPLCCKYLMWLICCSPARGTTSIGPDLFRAARSMGFEGLVSKHRDRPYRGGRQKHRVEVKNGQHPALNREL